MDKITRFILFTGLLLLSAGCNGKHDETWSIEAPLVVWGDLHRYRFLEPQKLPPEQDPSILVYIEDDNSVHDIDYHIMDESGLHKMLSDIPNGTSIGLLLDRSVSAEVTDKWLNEISKHPEIRFIYVSVNKQP